jgi:hypothetical protein
MAGKSALLPWGALFHGQDRVEDFWIRFAFKREKHSAGRDLKKQNARMKNHPGTVEIEIKDFTWPCAAAVRA